MLNKANRSRVYETNGRECIECLQICKQHISWFCYYICMVKIKKKVVEIIAIIKISNIFTLIVIINSFLVNQILSRLQQLNWIRQSEKNRNRKLTLINAV